MLIDPPRPASAAGRVRKEMRKAGGDRRPPGVSSRSDLEQGAQPPFTENKMAVTTEREMEILVVF